MHARASHKKRVSLTLPLFGNRKRRQSALTPFPESAGTVRGGWNQCSRGIGHASSAFPWRGLARKAGGGPGEIRVARDAGIGLKVF